MPFIPHTEQDEKDMLRAIGANSIDDLFDEIPEELRNTALDQVPDGISEMALGALVSEKAQQDDGLLCFIGAGAYQHHIPAAVWDVATRGEFMTAYTPYQAEASQGSLQLIYEYQSMMANLLDMEVSNASLYDGATALAEAVLMAVRLKSKKTKASVLMPKTVHPFFRQTVNSIVKQQQISLIEVPYDQATGQVDIDSLNTLINTEVVALIVPQPNFFGVLEEVDRLTDWATDHQILSIGVVNPQAMALLKPPGQWGKQGVDIVCGEGQPLGIPLASGGPYYGFLCCKKMHVRQMPGRIVGETIDADGRRGFVLTLQAREQHIRRGKATSNICTNQGLMVTASTIYMSLLGPVGLRRVAEVSHARTRQLLEKLLPLPGISQIFTSPFYHEIVLRFNYDVDKLLDQLATEHIQGGFALKPYYPELGETLLLCATEMKTDAEIERFANTLQSVLTGATT